MFPNSVVTRTGQFWKLAVAIVLMLVGSFADDVRRVTDGGQYVGRLEPAASAKALSSESSRPSSTK